ncbi:MAG: hypothetical protein K2J75_04450 [Clostridia bacterium]|nr:hypothetical protein [Clostridia bacterium]
MKTQLYKEQLKDNVVSAMLDYMSEYEDCGYSKKDVQKCEGLLLDYLDKLSDITNSNDEFIMEQVKNVVIALNKLNEETDYSLIETDAREKIWQIIQDSAVERGLSAVIEDVTEEWREW